MKNIITKINILLILVCLGGATHAQQNFYKYRIGPTVGTMFYYGELAENNDPVEEDARLTYGLNIERSLSKGFGLRLTGAVGQIAFEDQGEGSFETDIMDASATIVFYPDNDRFYLNDKAFISPYILGGFGITNFQEKDQEKDSSVYHIPVGLGLKFRLGDRWNANLETNVKYAFTDHLDGMVEQDDKSYDSYTSFLFGINYNFGVKKKTIKAPVFVVDKYAALSKEDSSLYKDNAILPALGVVESDGGEEELTRKEKRQAAKLAKKQACEAKKQCIADCKTLPRKERKACKAACKTEEGYKGYLEADSDSLSTDSTFVTPAEAAKQRLAKQEAELDSLENVVKAEQAAKKGEEVTTPTTSPTATPSATTVVPATTTPSPTTTTTLPTATPSSTTTIITPSNNGGGTNETTIRAMLNERDVQDLKMQLEILKLKQEQMQSGGGNNTTTEMYKLEVDRLRQENSDNKILNRIDQLEQRLLNLEGNSKTNTTTTIEKEIIIQQDGTVDSVKVVEDKDVLMKEINEEIKAVEKQIEEQQPPVPATEEMKTAPKEEAPKKSPINDLEELNSTDDKEGTKVEEPKKKRKKRKKRKKKKEKE